MRFNFTTLEINFYITSSWHESNEHKWTKTVLVFLLKHLIQEIPQYDSSVTKQSPPEDRIFIIMAVTIGDEIVMSAQEHGTFLFSSNACCQPFPLLFQHVQFFDFLWTEKEN